MNNLSKTKPSEDLPNLDGAIRIKAIVLCLVKLSGACPKMVLLGLLIIFSHALQACYMVIPPSGSPMRLSLPGLVIASTGKLKSFILNKLITPLVEYQHAQETALAEAIISYKVCKDIWNMDIKNLKKIISSKRNSGEDISEDTAMLQQIYKDEPEIPTVDVKLHSDSSIGSMLENPNNKLKTLLLASDEGSIVMEGSLLTRYLATIVNIISGSLANRIRSGTGKLDLSKTMLSLLIMIQDGPFEIAMEKLGKKLRDLGLLGRAICCYVPESYENGPMNPDDDETNSTMADYAKQMKELYQESDLLSLNPSVGIKYASFTTEGAELIGVIKQQVRENEQEGKIFGSMRDVSARVIEIIIKLCGIIHFIERKQGDISAETVKTATGIYVFFLPDHACIYDSEARRKRHAKILWQWFQDEYLSHNRRFLKNNDVIQGSPSGHIRNKHSVKLALNQLVYEGKIKFFCCGGTACIDLKPYTGSPIYEAKQELLKYEGLVGEIVYDTAYEHHYLLCMTQLPNGNTTSILDCTMALPAFSGFGRFANDENGELQEVDRFD